MIEAVAFDLWETLISETPELSSRTERLRLSRMEQVLAGAGFGAEAAGIERAYRSLWHRCHELYWSVDRDISCRRQVEHFLEALSLNPETFGEPALAALESAYALAATDILPSTVPGAVPLLSGLRGRGLRLGLVSNTGRTPGYALRTVLERSGLAPFDALVFSNEHGQCKPEPSIFEELRAGLGVAPEKTLFVGDNLYADVFGAQRAGMRGVHFVPPVRGAAVAPPFEHGLTIVPDATIQSLDELPEVVARFSAGTAGATGS